MSLSYDKEVKLILDNIITLIEEYPLLFYKPVTIKIYLKNIPVNLKPLIPLLKKWSVPDDSKREFLLESINEKQKKRLIKTVQLYMTEINDFLDSFKGNHLSYEATLLGNLAEFISEIDYIIP